MPGGPLGGASCGGGGPQLQGKRVERGQLVPELQLELSGVEPLGLGEEQPAAQQLQLLLGFAASGARIHPRRNPRVLDLLPIHNGAARVLGKTKQGM